MGRRDCIAQDGCTYEAHALGVCLARDRREHASGAWVRLLNAAKAVSIEALRNTGPRPSTGESSALDELGAAAVGYARALDVLG